MFLKKEGYHLFSYQLTLSSIIFHWVFGACKCVCVCVFCLFTPLVSVFVFYRKNLVLVASNQQTLWLLQVNNFLKEMTLWKANFWYQWIINSMFQCNKDSCCEHIAGGVSIYLYGCVSLLARECSVCLCRADLGLIWQWSPLLGARKLVSKKTFSCEKQTCICYKKTLIYVNVSLLQFSGSLSCN